MEHVKLRLKIEERERERQECIEIEKEKLQFELKLKELELQGKSKSKLCLWTLPKIIYVTKTLDSFLLFKKRKLTNIFLHFEKVAENLK